MQNISKGSDALLSVTFDGEETDPISLSAMEEIKQRLAPYDASIDSTVGDSQAETLDQEMQVIFAVSVVIIVLVLGLTSHSLCRGSRPLAYLRRRGSAEHGNQIFLLGEISFVSDSVTVVLQLALAIDYAIILLHRFLEARQHTLDDRSACITALSAAIPANFFPAVSQPFPAWPP